MRVENFLENSLLDLLGKRRIVEVGSWDQVLRKLGLHDSLLDQLIEGTKIQRSSVLGVTLCLRGVVLEGCDMGLEGCDMGMELLVV